MICPAWRPDLLVFSTGNVIVAQNTLDNGFSVVFVCMELPLWSIFFVKVYPRYQSLKSFLKPIQKKDSFVITENWLKPCYLAQKSLVSEKCFLNFKVVQNFGQLLLEMSIKLHKKYLKQFLPCFLLLFFFSLVIFLSLSKIKSNF